MEIYVTKYALTKRGILNIFDDGTCIQKYASGYIIRWYDEKIQQWRSEYFYNRDVYFTEEDALAHVAKMKIAKIASLQKKIDALR